MSGAFDESCQVEVLDALAEGIELSQLLAHIEPSAYGAIVVQTCSLSWREDLETLRLLAGHGAHIVMNGDYGVRHAREVLDDASLGVHAVVMDMAAGGLGSYVTSGGEQAAGIYRRADDAPPAPASSGTMLRPRHELFPLKRYTVPWALQRPVTTIYASHGCTMSCKFCLAGTFSFRTRPVEEVVEELRKIRDLGVPEVVFFDQLFDGNAKRALEICARIRDEELGLSWSCFSHVGHLRPEVMDALVAAGCHTVLLGLESGSDRILKAMKKGQTTADVRAKIAEIRRHGLRVGGFFLLGYPAETDDDIQQTIRFSQELNLTFASFQCAVPFDGTPMGDELRNHGIVDSFAGYDDGDAPFSLNAQRTSQELVAWRQEAIRSFYLRPGYVARRLFGIRSRTEFVNLAREGMRMLL